MNRHLRQTFRQADAFKRRFDTLPNASDQSDLLFYAKLNKLSAMSLRYQLLRHRVLKDGMWRSILTLLTV